LLRPLGGGGISSAKISSDDGGGGVISSAKVSSDDGEIIEPSIVNPTPHRPFGGVPFRGWWGRVGVRTWSDIFSVGRDALTSSLLTPPPSSFCRWNDPSRHGGLSDEAKVRRVKHHSIPARPLLMSIGGGECLRWKISSADGSIIDASTHPHRPLSDETIRPGAG
jgi:hypothetical protein